MSRRRAYARRAGSGSGATSKQASCPGQRSTTAAGGARSTPNGPPSEPLIGIEVYGAKTVFVCRVCDRGFESRAAAAGHYVKEHYGKEG